MVEGSLVVSLVSGRESAHRGEHRTEVRRDALLTVGKPSRLAFWGEPVAQEKAGRLTYRISEYGLRLHHASRRRF
jgi:hypothetical protein